MVNKLYQDINQIVSDLSQDFILCHWGVAVTPKTRLKIFQNILYWQAEVVLLWSVLARCAVHVYTVRFNEDTMYGL